MGNSPGKKHHKMTDPSGAFVSFSHENTVFLESDESNEEEKEHTDSKAINNNNNEIKGELSNDGEKIKPKPVSAVQGSTLPHKCSQCCRSSADEDDSGNVRALKWPLIIGWQRLLLSGNVIYIAPCHKILQDYEGVMKYLRQTESKLGIDCFNFDAEVDCVKTFDSGCVTLIEDISEGAEALPIRVVGEQDAEPPCKFKYTTTILPSDGSPDFLSHPHRDVCCDCTDDGCVDKKKCKCIMFNIKRCQKWRKGLRNPTDASIGYEYKRLLNAVETGIFECHGGCKCSNQCANRVAQMPISQSLELFDTEECGWGVRCVNDLPAGAFVSCYLGDMIDGINADRRGATTGDTYLYDVHAHIDVPLSAIETKRRKMMTLNENNNDCYVVDGNLSGNISRFFNHSCYPNLFEQNVYIDTHDLRFPHLAFFTKEFIKAGEELTIDYGYKPFSVPGRILYCHCRSHNCRKRLL